MMLVDYMYSNNRLMHNNKSLSKSSNNEKQAPSQEGVSQAVCHECTYKLARAQQKLLSMQHVS